MKLRVAGLDPSERSTGLVVLQFQLKRPPAVWLKRAIQITHATGLERAAIQAAELGEVLDEARPDLLMIEDYAFVHRKTIQGAIETGTCFRLKCRQLEVPFITVPPLQLKKFVRGKGSGDKADMAAAVLTKWGFRDDCDDIVDAYALALMGLALKGVDFDLSERQQEAVDGLVY